MKNSAPRTSVVVEPKQYAEVPDGWVQAELASFATLITKGTTPTSLGFEYEPKGISFVRVENLSDGRIDRFSISTFVNKAADEALKRSRLQVGDLLFSIAGTIGRTALVAAEDLPANTNQALAIIRGTDPVIIPQLLQFALASSITQRQARSDARGGSMSNISLEDVRTMQLTIPPRAEQARILPRLEELLGVLKSAHDRLTQIPKLLETFRQSVLGAACSGRLTEDWREKHPAVESACVGIEELKKVDEITVRRGVPERVLKPEEVSDWQMPETWGCYSAADLLRFGAFIDIKDGNHGANHPKVSDFTDTGLPFITAAQVDNFCIDYDGAYKLSGAPLQRIRVGRAKSGDVIYTHKGSVGRVAVCDRDCVLTPQTTYYRLSPRIFASGFLMYYLASRAFTEQVNAVKEQTTRDFVPISEQYLLFHRVPPLSEQHEIVRRVEALFRLATKIEERMAKATKRADRLMQAILAKTFRGELVPTEAELARQEGRTYEPASVLLERVKSERETYAALSNSTKRRRAAGKR